MKKRILFGAIMIAFIVGVLLLDEWLETARVMTARGLPLAVVFLALVIVAYLELARMALAAGGGILITSGLFGSLTLATLPFWWQMTAADPAVMVLLAGLVVPAIVLLLAFVEQMARYRTEGAFIRLACTTLIVVYLGVGGALTLWIRMRYGVPMLVLYLAAVKFTDIGAYFTGSAIGRHKMIPWLSPGKSWEGLVGGVVVGAGVSVAVTATLGVALLAWWEAAVFGVLVALAGQFADLCESLLKRSVRIKDSGAVVPEFGGVMDIIDSPLLAAPAAVVILTVLAG